MKNLIIDGTNLLYRTWHSSRNKDLVNSYGRDVSHVLWFLKALKNIVKTIPSDRKYLTWDSTEGDFVNFRHEGTDYKGHRNRDDYELIHANDKIIKKLCQFLGFVNITANKMEADDVIAWICLELYPDDENVIVSSDQDFYQLVSFGKNVSVYSPIKDLLVTESNFIEYVNVKPKLFLLYKAVKGDSSDNLKGVYGYGPVKAVKFVNNFKENFEALDNEDKKIIIKNIKLMDLSRGYNYYEDEVDHYRNQNGSSSVNFDNFFKVCEKLELNSILNNKGEWKRIFREGNDTPMLSLIEELLK